MCELNGIAETHVVRFRLLSKVKYIITNNSCCMCFI